MFALLSFAGFFRKTFWILPSIDFCISCLLELGWTFMFNLMNEEDGVGLN